MGVTQFLESKPVKIAETDYLVVEMTASDRVAVMEVAQSLFSSEENGLSIGHQLMLTSLIVQRSLRNVEFDLVFKESDLNQVPKTLSRRILNEVYEMACQLSELDFLLGKPEKSESHDRTEDRP